MYTSADTTYLYRYYMIYNSIKRVISTIIPWDASLETIIWNRVDAGDAISNHQNMMMRNIVILLISFVFLIPNRKRPRRRDCYNIIRLYTTEQSKRKGINPRIFILYYAYTMRIYIYYWITFIYIFFPICIIKTRWNVVRAGWKRTRTAVRRDTRETEK